MILLPALIFCAEVVGTRVLEVWWQDDGFVPSFSGELNPQVPGIKSDEDEVQTLADEVLLSKCVDGRDCIAERASVSNMLPSQSRQASCGCRSGMILGRASNGQRLTAEWRYGGV